MFTLLHYKRFILIEHYVFFRFILKLYVLFRRGRPIHLLNIFSIAMYLICEALLVLSFLLPLLFLLFILINNFLIEPRLVVLYLVGGFIGELGLLSWIVRCIYHKASSFQAEFFPFLSDYFLVFASVARYFVF